MCKINKNENPEEIRQVVEAVVEDIVFEIKHHCERYRWGFADDILSTDLSRECKVHCLDEKHVKDIQKRLGEVLQTICVDPYTGTTYYGLIGEAYYFVKVANETLCIQVPFENAQTHFMMAEYITDRICEHLKAEFGGAETMNFWYNHFLPRVIEKEKEKEELCP